MNDIEYVTIDENSAINSAFAMAHKVDLPCYAIEGKYGWNVAERKPSIRFGKVWECFPSGEKFYG